MRLGSKHPFLVLKRTDDGKSHRVQIVRSREEVLRKWTSSTRISPLFGLTEIAASSPDQVTFSRLTHVIFLGPLHPEKVLPFCGNNTCLWLTLGLFNILFTTRSKAAAQALLKWLKDKGVAYEQWWVRSGIVQSKAASEEPVEDSSWRKTIEKSPA